MRQLPAKANLHPKVLFIDETYKNYNKKFATLGEQNKALINTEETNWINEANAYFNKLTSKTGRKKYQLRELN